MKYAPWLVLAFLTIKTAYSSDAIKAFDAKEYDKAKQLFEKKLKQKENKNQALLYLARIAMNQNELDDAEDYLNNAMEIIPNDADEHYWYGLMSGLQAANASIFTAGSYAADTREHFSKAIELDPKHLMALKGLTNFHIQAPSIVGGDKEKALKIVEKIKAIDPIEGSVIELSLYTSEKATEKSLTAARYLIENFPQSARGLFAAGMTYQNLKQYSDAHETLTKASQIKPDADEERQVTYLALYQIGRTAVFSGENLVEGIRAFESYIKLELPTGAPDKQWAKFRLSSLLVKNGDKPTAKTLLTSLKNETIADKNLQKQLEKAYKEFEI